MGGDCNFILCRERLTEDVTFKQNLEVGQGRGRLVLEGDCSGQKLEQAQNTEEGTCSRNRKEVGVAGWK